MWFFPLYDDNKTLDRPHVTWVILVACVLAYLWQVGLGDSEGEAILALGMIPARIFGFGEFPPELIWVPSYLTIFTSMFLHGGFLHLAGNMLYLWIFADNVEDSMGPLRFSMLYIASGIVAALSQSFVDTSSTTPMIGASGAIAGTLGAYLMLHPRANVRCLVGFFIFFRRINIPAAIVLLFWIGLQFWNLSDSQSNVAYWAHIGGFITGAALIPFLRRPGVPLFAKSQSKAFDISPMQRAHIPTIASQTSQSRNKFNRPERRHPWDE